jgi:hypothetical protein
MQTFTVTFFLMADHGEMTRSGVLPFVPCDGQYLRLPRDDHRVVDGVFYDVEKPGELLVYFRDAEGARPAVLRKQGWLAWRPATPGKEGKAHA